jgi:protein regulator of cytokinesis 1
MSVAERALFDAYFRIQDDEHLTSAVLAKHEDYVASLKAKLRRMQPILDLIAKREEERIELELLQKDPDRLKSRGATKQLMKEEKMNRRVTKELPKITSILEKTLRQWWERTSDGLFRP